VLSAYKIAVEAPGSGARPVLSGLDMVLYGVPNSDPPPRPSVSVRLVAPAAGEPELVAEVTVAMRAGVTAGVTARVYRTRGDRADPMVAPQIAQVALGAPNAASSVQTAVWRDLGAAEIAPAARLKAFARYQWIAEVQGAPESGSSIPGAWSRPSDPVSLLTVPLDAPAAPLLGAFGGTAVPGGTQDLTLSVSHPLGLTPTTAGPWRWQLQLRELDGSTTLASEGQFLVEPAVISCGGSAGAVTPSGTTLLLRLFDPVGRQTPVLEAVTP
jgi:hypothetical protein